MNAERDDYAPTRENSTHTTTHETEPADPSIPNHTERRAVPLAPASVKPSRLPDPLVEDVSPLPVDEAKETYCKVVRSNWKSDGYTSKYERHRYELYPRILEADRRFQTDFEGVTTAMISRRLSPLDEAGDWLTPWEQVEMLHGGKVHKSLRQTLNYQLGEFDFEWVAVTAPTRSAGTPHEHIYLWINDPQDEIETGHLAPALDKHLKYCANAYEKHHRYRTDGSGGAITVEHSPDCVDRPPEEFFQIVENSPVYADTGTLPAVTAGAQYLASQLAHLPLGDYYDGQQEDPPAALLEGATAAWATPYCWFRASGAVPEIEVESR